MNTAHEVRLREWETVRPDAGGDHPSQLLAGRMLDADARRTAARLTDEGQIEILELARGIELRATSFVGRFPLGDLTITVEPKLRGGPLVRLLRYAYGLRQLQLLPSIDHAESKWAFQDLLVLQLIAEARELLTRGLHKDYEIARTDLHSPRGRIDFGRYLQTANGSTTTLPCIHHPRVEDTLLNQTLLAGLQFASRMTNDLNLRASLNRISFTMGATVSSRALDAALVADCRRRADRRTTAYRPAISIIELLYGDEGIVLANGTERVRLKGFLFDMNRFFQALVSRFLVNNLEGYRVEEESRLTELMTYDPLRNPLRRRPPTPRPDFVIRYKDNVVAVLDAKYRDLWERPLPREMLYQLSLYALSQKGERKRAAILYPTLSQRSQEQAILIRDPASGANSAEVVLRPVNLTELDRFIVGGSSTTIRQQRDLARRLAFGSEVPD